MKLITSIKIKKKEKIKTKLRKRGSYLLSMLMISNGRDVKCWHIIKKRNIKEVSTIKNKIYSKRGRIGITTIGKN